MAEKLRERSIRVWYDEFAPQWGDSLRQSFDRGLTRSRFGIVILSENFFSKKWPQYELDGFVARESVGVKVILPLWHKISKNEVMQFGPTLADRLALNMAQFTFDEIVEKITKILKDSQTS